MCGLWAMRFGSAKRLPMRLPVPATGVGPARAPTRPRAAAVRVAVRAPVEVAPQAFLSCGAGGVWARVPSAAGGGR